MRVPSVSATPTRQRRRGPCHLFRKRDDPSAHAINAALGVRDQCEPRTTRHPGSVFFQVTEIPRLTWQCQRHTPLYVNGRERHADPSSGRQEAVFPESCCISPEVVIIGEIILGEQVSILPGVVLRADNEPIVVDDDSNIRRKMCCTPSPAYR